LIKLTFDLDGATFIFMGEEYGLTKDVPLFEKDPIDLSIKNDEIASLYEHELKNKNHLITSQFISFDGDLVLNTNIDGKLINKRYKLKPNT